MRELNEHGKGNLRIEKASCGTGKEVNDTGSAISQPSHRRFKKVLV
jgi:hypothetical protein